MTTQHREGLRDFREHRRRVFGVDAPPEPAPIRAAMPPELVAGYVRPLPVEHAEGCTSTRVETVGVTDGRRLARCLDCSATATARP